jgi:hypothetical protein
MSIFTTPNLASTGSLNIPAFFIVPPLPNFVAEWAALIPLICHLASYLHPHQLAGKVALLGRVSVTLFPKLGVLSGMSKLVERGPEFLDIASTIGPSSRNVWDVKWGGEFQCANGAASGYLIRSLSKHRRLTTRLPESVPPMHATPFFTPSKQSSTSIKQPETVSVATEGSTLLDQLPEIFASSAPYTSRSSSFRRFQTLQILNCSKSPPRLS